jgi:periplasmic protein TonB
MTQREASKTSFSVYGDEAATALLTFREEVIDAPLQAVISLKPEYPTELKASETEGWATISFIVDGEGRVRVPAVSDASRPEFGTATLAVMRQWKFNPGRRGGRIVQVSAERTVNFRLPRATR